MNMLAKSYLRAAREKAIRTSPLGRLRSVFELQVKVLRRAYYLNRRQGVEAHLLNEVWASEAKLKAIKELIEEDQ